MPWFFPQLLTADKAAICLRMVRAGGHGRCMNMGGQKEKRNTAHFSRWACSDALSWLIEGGGKVHVFELVFIVLLGVLSSSEVHGHMCC